MFALNSVPWLTAHVLSLPACLSFCCCDKNIMTRETWGRKSLLHLTASKSVIQENLVAGMGLKQRSQQNAVYLLASGLLNLSSYTP